MAKQSFSDAIKQEPERFVRYAFEKNPNIKDFSDFDDAFREAFDTSNGANAKIDSDDIIVLFESPTCKNRMKENVSKEELDNLYGDGVKVQRVAVSKKKVVTIVSKKVIVKSHTWKGRIVKGATRTTPKKFTPAETKFLKVRKQRGVSTTKIIKEFEGHFSKSPRTKSSLSTKIYRI